MTTGRPGPKEAAVVLLNVGKDCQESRVERLNAAGELEVSAEWIGACWACGAEMAKKPPRLAVFSRGNAAVVLEGAEVCGRIKGSELAIKLKRRETLSLDVWIPANPENPEAVAVRTAEARDEFTNADWLLDRNMVGVTLKPNFQTADRGTLPDGCASLRNANKADLSFTKDSLNVYFVGNSNVNCGAGQNGLFVRDGNALGDLAHEIGHRLGLRQLAGRDGITYISGHTNNAPGFDCSNTMWDHSGIPDNELTIGQAFWMGLSCESAAGQKRKDKKCIPCLQARGGPPCVPFSLTAPLEPGQMRGGCKPCTEQASGEIRRQVPAAARLPVNLVTDQVQLCTFGEVTAKIEARYDELVKHMSNLPEVRLGTPDKAKFVQRWADAGIAVLKIDLASKEQDPKKREEWINHLSGKEWINYLSGKAGELRVLSAANTHLAYLDYSLEKLRKNEPIERCSGGGTYQ